MNASFLSMHLYLLARLRVGLATADGVPPPEISFLARDPAGNLGRTGIFDNEFI